MRGLPSMKIYSSKRLKLDSEIFDSLIGKDVWIKVYDPCYSDYDWIRVVSKDPKTHKYTCNMVIDTEVSQDGTCPCSLSIYNVYLTSEWNFSATSFRVVRPIDTVTTEEFFRVIE